MKFEEVCAKLKELGFTHAIRVMKDVSVISVGTIVSAFITDADARSEASRLSAMYHDIRSNSFMMVTL